MPSMPSPVALLTPPQQHIIELRNVRHLVQRCFASGCTSAYEQWTARHIIGVPIVCVRSHQERYRGGVVGHLVYLRILGLNWNVENTIGKARSIVRIMTPRALGYIARTLWMYPSRLNRSAIFSGAFVDVDHILDAKVDVYIVQYST